MSGLARIFSACLLMTLSLLLRATSALAGEATVDTKASTMQLAKQDILDLAKLEFKGAPRLFLYFFGGSKGADLQTYVLKSSKGLGYTQSSDGSSGEASNGIIFLNAKYSSYSQVLRWNILLHESRHNEGGFGHTLCPANYSFDGVTYSGVNEYLQGKLACDRGGPGAYGVTFAFFMAIAENCTSCSPEMKAAAATRAFQDGLTRILTEKEVQFLIENGSANPNATRTKFREFLKKVSSKAP